jgi:hypothetical protein
MSGDCYYTSGGNSGRVAALRGGPDNQAGFCVSNAHGVPDAIGDSIAQGGQIRAFDQRDEIMFAGDSIDLLDHGLGELHPGQFLHEILNTAGFGFNKDKGLNY